MNSRAPHGLRYASAVTVEVYTANGLPRFVLVGLADTEVREARERVRAALEHSGLPYPGNQRITVNLALADLPKDSGRFDLPMALGLLAAAWSPWFESVVENMSPAASTRNSPCGHLA